MGKEIRRKVFRAAGYVMTALSALLSLAGCTGKGDRLSPYRWEKISLRYDSLTLCLESLFRVRQPAELLSVYIDSCERMSKGEPESLAAVRAAYWRARLLQREGYGDSAVAVVKGAMARLDSARHTYDYFRLRGILRHLEAPGGARSYRDIDEEARYYQKIGDMPMTASSFISLGTALYTIGEFETSREYLSKANEINSSLGFSDMVAKNTINLANLYYSSGRREEARSMLEELLDSPDIKSDSSAYNLVLRNLYANTQEVKWLERAYRQIKDVPAFRGNRGLYEVLLSENFEKEEMYDSASFYTRLAMDDLPYISDYGYRGMVMQGYARMMHREGNIDSSYHYLKRFIEYSDSDYVQRQEGEVLRLANLREVSLERERQKMATQQMRLWLIGIVFLVALVGGLVFFFYYRRNKRREIQVRDMRLEMEKSHRKLLAANLAMEEKNNLVVSLREEVEKLRKEGSIGAQEAFSLENTIRLHIAGNEERETFQEVFEQINPAFMAKIRNAYPSLSESYVKLASYIFMGMDNNKIARLLMIRPESVKQSRWRLRKMMGLEKGASLDEAIRRLGEDI